MPMRMPGGQRNAYQPKRNGNLPLAAQMAVSTPGAMPGSKVPPTRMGPVKAWRTWACLLAELPRWAPPGKSLERRVEGYSRWKLRIDERLRDDHVPHRLARARRDNVRADGISLC